MPCTYDHDYGYDLKICRDELEKVTRLFCEVLTGNPSLGLSEECSLWWQEHQKQDRRRKEREAEDAARAAKYAIESAQRALDEADERKREAAAKLAALKGTP